ncbi:hypothetical protein [Sphingobium boeckii]|uniref:Uncharacterized protein n=1 Tax=Sphingobium boeckii TaxID=1082345 RepID=A0A7W9ECH8_9SPHN|nr:hypothetical protein [Sphingobium boeckii]MBB5684288.1 hypothetical protein [Sphingobium boeckii]
MAIITPHAPLPLRSVSWRLSRPGQLNRSEWTGARKYIGLPGAAKWTASGEFPPILRPEMADAWIAFFMDLDGQANSFPLIAVERAQTGAANPTVAGGAQTGYQLNLTGLAGGVGDIFLKRGMRMSIPLPNGTVQLVVLRANLIVGSGTNGIAYFRTALRQSPANGATIEAQKPYALMCLTGDSAGWDVAPGQIYGFEFEAEEAF